jgi:hypothetical protein
LQRFNGRFAATPFALTPAFEITAMYPVIQIRLQYIGAALELLTNLDLRHL